MFRRMLIAPFQDRTYALALRHPRGWNHVSRDVKRMSATDRLTGRWGGLEASHDYNYVTPQLLYDRLNSRSVPAGGVAMRRRIALLTALVGMMALGGGTFAAAPAGAVQPERQVFTDSGSFFVEDCGGGVLLTEDF
jgi:hypothetical protein